MISPLKSLATLQAPTVLAHGVFDILHIGHIRYLSAAKKLGSTLVVTVTCDKYVNKGPGRPVFTEKLRAEAIDALKCVDYVAINTSRTAVEAIRTIKPTFYVKGGEYVSNETPMLLKEKAAVESSGGRLVFLNNDEWHSSNLIHAQNTFLYIRGEPGAGKITIARMLEKELGWQLFWMHSLNDIFKIIGDHKSPRLIDDITRPILQHMFQQEKNIIYVRPSRDLQTVEKVRSLAINAGYRFVLVHLTANYEDLCKRVESRPKIDCRIASKSDLDEYLTSRKPAAIDNEYVINTSNFSPEEAVRQIVGVISCKPAT